MIEAGVHNDRNGFDDIACGNLLEAISLIKAFLGVGCQKGFALLGVA